MYNFIELTWLLSAALTRVSFALPVWMASVLLLRLSSTVPAKIACSF